MICDNHGRPTLNFRISVTQKCNLQCPYCHREGQTSSSTEMSADEILRITQVALALGISRVKLTGGEALLRSDILEIVKGLAELRGLKDLSMTTNGTLLASKAKALRENGLTRVNVNLPTLDSRVYRELIGGNLKDVLEGIKVAVELGLYPVKLNMLVLKGINDEEIPRMVNFAKRSGTILQIIELEPINVKPAYYSRRHQPLNDVEAELEKQALEVKTRQYMQNRKVYFLPDAKVEVIRPIENTEFCARCTRIRLTSDGKLKPCLMRNDNLVDILTPLRNGADRETLTKIFVEAIKKREPYYKVEQLESMSFS
jgi:cyclic pyranopterin phosphate synthase